MSASVFKHTDREAIMFRLYFTNFDYYSQNEHLTLSEAISAARKAGFQVRIDCEAEYICAICPINGARLLNDTWREVFYSAIRS